MQMTAELFAYFARAAQGDESDCPRDLDVQWHACLADPKAYTQFCLRNFGVVIEHVVNTPAPCKAKIQGHCRAVVRR